MLSVSAIVPTCDRPILLDRALRSIARQVLVPSEIIVVDDGSEPHQKLTREAMARHDFGNAQVVPNAHCKGAGGARNTGAETARGELLAFLDDDDEWLPSYLFEAVRRFELDDLDVVCTDLLCQFVDGVDRAAKTAPQRLTAELFLTRNPGFGGSNIVIRRSLYGEIGGFDESLLTANDMDLGLRLSLRHNVKYHRLPERLVRFHEHGGPKLCTPAGDAMRAGIRRFYELHSHRMTEAQREEFRINVRQFWGIDEHGKSLNLSPKAYADSLLPRLKAWLDQHRAELQK